LKLVPLAAPVAAVVPMALALVDLARRVRERMAVLVLAQAATPLAAVVELVRLVRLALVPLVVPGALAFKTTSPAPMSITLAAVVGVSSPEPRLVPPSVAAGLLGLAARRRSARTALVAVVVEPTPTGLAVALMVEMAWSSSDIFRLA
jgi:hypothetical protein